MVPHLPPVQPQTERARKVRIPHGLLATAALKRVLKLEDTGVLQATFPTPRRKTVELHTGTDGRDSLWDQLHSLMSMDRFQQRADAVVALQRFTRHAAAYGPGKQSPAVRNLESNADEVYTRCLTERRGLEIREVRPCLEGLVQHRADWWAVESNAIRQKTCLPERDPGVAALERDFHQLLLSVHPLKTGAEDDRNAFNLCLLLLNSLDSHIQPPEVKPLGQPLIQALGCCATQIARVSSVDLHVQSEGKGLPLPPVSVSLFSPAERAQAVAWGIATEHALAQAGFSNQHSQLNDLNALLVQRLARLAMPYKEMLGQAREGHCQQMQMAASEFIASFKATVTQLRLLGAALNSPEYRRAIPAEFEASRRELLHGLSELLACLDDRKGPFQAAVRAAQQAEKLPYLSMSVLSIVMGWPEPTPPWAQ